MLLQISSEVGPPAPPSPPVPLSPCCVPTGGGVVCVGGHGRYYLSSDTCCSQRDHPQQGVTVVPGRMLTLLFCTPI